MKSAWTRNTDFLIPASDEYVTVVTLNAILGLKSWQAINCFVIQLYIVIISPCVSFVMNMNVLYATLWMLYPMNISYVPVVYKN